MTQEKIRLHITPFAPDFSAAILSSAIAPQAENISFHTLQTFPENSYGYVDLPVVEAEKLKKKLNGSLLKGRKIRIENARPSKRISDEAGEETDNRSISHRQPVTGYAEARSSKNQTLSGYQMPEDRKVKRGWTEPRKKDKKKKLSSTSEAPASKYTDKEECIFRAKIPQNKTKINGPQDELKKKKSKRPAGQAVIHEFEKTSLVPSFLRDNALSGKSSDALSYEDGKGWVDRAGNVIESGPKSPLQSKLPLQMPYKRKRPADAGTLMQGGDGSSTLEHSKPSGTIQFHPQKFLQASPPNSASSADSTSSSDIESTSCEGDSDSSTSDPGSGYDSLSASSSRLESNDIDNVSRSGSSVESASAPAIIDSKPAPHPLEALFKRPAPVKRSSQDSIKTPSKPPLEISTSFSFFDPEVEDDVQPSAPLTPFTSRDIQTRNLRSAAPTPDTAAPSRTSFFPGGSRPESVSGADDDDEDNEDEDEDEDAIMGEMSSTLLAKRRLQSDLERPPKGIKKSQAAENSVNAEQSEFVKWFYEHRGENNRLWKRRRREAAKEKRQAENRKIAKSTRRR
ncbi:putative suppressor protein srp40 [Phaeomoniella chlamydospora]|uniref:Putative suppressor protein srp40 n=1 Tax=Phaeomoniella chlamydospora TaxID=158046 RepID=A0A0G2EY00_PHACM|nr:putative suppressor protein srp40 [Phaeomoniella chlamydospora]